MAGIDEELDALEAAALPALENSAVPGNVDAELDALELAALAPVPEQAAPPGAAPVLEAAPQPTRFNVVRDGQLANVGEENLPEAYRQGYRLDASEAPSTGSVQLLEDGRVNTYDAADPAVREKIALGAQLATPEEVEREFGDLGSQLATAGEGFAQGATMGGYGYVADKVGGDQYTADRQLREQINPGTSIVSNLGGAAVPALMSGGSGALARAAALTPVGALSKGAQLAGRIAEGLAPKLATSVAGRVGLQAALAGGEGAIDNATRQVLDDITNDNVDATAERMMDAAWEGAKWGGLFGGGGALVGEGLSAAASKLGKRGAEAADEAVPGHFDEASQIQEEAAAQGRPRADIDADLDLAHQRLAEADQLGNPAAVEEAENALDALMKEQEGAVLRDMGARTDADLEVSLKVAPPPEAQGILAKLDAQLNTAKNAKDLGLKVDDLTDDLTRSITDDVDNLQRYYQNDLGPQISRHKKPGAIKQALADEGVVWTPQQAERVLRENDQLLKALEEVRAEYVLGDDVAKRKLAPIKAAQVAIEGVQKRLRGTNGAGPVAKEARILRHMDLDGIADVFWSEDSLKSYLGNIAKKKGEIMTPAEGAVQKLYMRKRASLQDPRLYGNKLAEMQTVTNAAESKAIPAQRVFQSKFGASNAHLGERAGEHGFDMLNEADPKSTKSLVRRLGEADAYKDERDFVAGLHRQLEMAETKAKYYPVDPESAAQLASARAAVEGITEKLRTAKELNLRKMQAQRMAAEGSPIQDIVQGLRALPWGASITGAITGAGRGLAAATVSLAQGAVKAEKAVEGAAKKTARNFFRGAAQRAGEKLSKPVGGIGITANAVRKAVEEAQALQDPNSTVSRNLHTQIRALREDSPDLAQALDAKVRQRAELILSKAGPAVDDSDPFQPGRRPPMDRITEMRLARYVEASQNIDKVLGRLAEGTASLEDVEVLKANRPQQFARYVQKVQAEMANAKEAPDPQARARLHLMLGAPMGRDQTPQALASYARMAAPPPEQKAPPKPKGPRFTFGSRESFGSRSDQIVSGGDGS